MFITELSSKIFDFATIGLHIGNPCQKFKTLLAIPKGVNGRCEIATGELKCRRCDIPYDRGSVVAPPPPPI